VEVEPPELLNCEKETQAKREKMKKMGERRREKTKLFPSSYGTVVRGGGEPFT
jgi:hypothetical protein